MKKVLLVLLSVIILLCFFGCVNKSPQENIKLESKPSEGEKNLSVNCILNWDYQFSRYYQTDSELLYDVYIDTKEIPDRKIVENTKSKTCQLQNLKSNTKYYWKVVAKLNNNVVSNNGIWSFTTGGTETSKNYGSSSYDGMFKIIPLSEGGYLGFENNNSSADNLNNKTDSSRAGGLTNLYTYSKIRIIKFDQDLNKEWEKNYEGNVWDVIKTRNNEYILVGCTLNNNYYGKTHDLHDGLIIKIDSMGNIVWSKVYGGNKYDVLNKVKETSDGGYIISGYTNSNDGDIAGNHGDFDFWVLKVDKEGNKVWSKCYGGSVFDYAKNIEVCSDGYVVIGNNEYYLDRNIANRGGVYDVKAFKIDFNGNIIWSKIYGGSGCDYLEDLKVLKDGSIILGGYTNSDDYDLTKPYNFLDAWLLKIDKDGNIIWSKKYSGDNSYGDDRIYSLKLTDTGIVACGITNSNNGIISSKNGSYDGIIYEFDNDGNLLSTKVSGGSKNDELHCFDIISDNIYIAGGISESKDGDLTNNYGYEDSWILKIKK